MSARQIDYNCYFKTRHPLLYFRPFIKDTFIQKFLKFPQKTSEMTTNYIYVKNTCVGLLVPASLSVLSCNILAYQSSYSARFKCM